MSESAKIDSGTLNLNWSRALFAELADLGVQRVVISPGSRSTPLTLAALEQPGLRHWVMVDERSAAFFALGLAKRERRPTALIATSGSAPANWYPAVVEAAYAHIPLLLLSADRPAELQNCGANQTIDQVELFGRHVRAFANLGPDDGPLEPAHVQRLFESSLGPIPGPVHLNIPLREPLLPEPLGPPSLSAPSCATIEQPAPQAPDTARLEKLLPTLGASPGLIVCGWGHERAGFASQLAHLARRLQAPVLADPLSQLRYAPDAGPNVLSRYDGFLRNTAFTRAHEPAWVMRFGALPVSKPLQSYLEGVATEHFIQIDPLGQFLDPLQRCREQLPCDPGLFCQALGDRLPQGPDSSPWLQDFLDAEGLVAEAQAGLEGFFEGPLIRELMARLPAHSLLFSGNSMAIRDLDGFMGSSDKPLSLFANRGTSGIDGNLSTLLGLAAAYRGEGQVVGLLGDLTFYHDMNALLGARDFDATLILLNNGGGGIFSYLPQAELDAFEHAWLTPTGLDFAQAARLYRLPHRRVESLEAFSEGLAWAFAEPGLSLLEVVIEREYSVHCHRRYWQQLAAP